MRFPRQFARLAVYGAGRKRLPKAHTHTTTLARLEAGFLDPELAPVPLRSVADILALAASTPRAGVGVLGVGLDDNSSFMRGSSLAPAAIRLALHSDSANSSTEGTETSAASSASSSTTTCTPIREQQPRNLDKHPDICDYGDLLLPSEAHAAGGVTEVRMAAVSDAIEAIVAAGLKPLVLGGDHSLTYPIIRGLNRAASSKELVIVHFDAHSDMYDYDVTGGNNRYSHASPFARILEEGLAQKVIQIGIRTMTAHLWEQQQRLNPLGKIYTMQEIMTKGAAVVAAELASATDAPTHSQTHICGKNVYISVDLDCLDPAFAPGVSHYEPGGLSTRELLHFIQTLDRDSCIVGADCVEFNPMRDPGTKVLAFLVQKYKY